MSSLRQILEKISTELPKAQLDPLKGHPLVGFAEKEAVQDIMGHLSLNESDDLFVKASLGEGNWANVPWIAFLSRMVTSSTTYGYYPVYLWSADCQTIYLSMGQGVTKVKDEFGKQWKQTLRNRSAIIRSRVPEYKEYFTANSPILNGRTPLAKQYEEAPAFSKSYKTNSLPTDNELLTDLKKMLSLYDKLIFSGGTDLIENDDSDAERGKNLSLSEKKQYRVHRIIEGRANTKAVKEHHGYTCQVCSFDFEKAYGELGKDYIEAHHLVPYSELQEGASRTLSIETDFVVLCANCHRMIHRMDDPGDIGGLKKRLR